MLFDYQPETGDAEALRVKQGEQVEIISKEERDWWLARNEHGQTGRVPANFVRQNKVSPHTSSPPLYIFPLTLSLCLGEAAGAGDPRAGSGALPSGAQEEAAGD